MQYLKNGCPLSARAISIILSFPQKNFVKAGIKQLSPKTNLRSFEH
jgi:hypothetical protein